MHKTVFDIQVPSSWDGCLPFPKDKALSASTGLWSTGSQPRCLPIPCESFFDVSCLRITVFLLGKTLQNATGKRNLLMRLQPGLRTAGIANPGSVLHALASSSVTAHLMHMSVH